MKLMRKLLIIVAVATSTMASEPLTVAVFDFEAKDALKDFGPQFASLISAQLSTDTNVITVERAELDKALGEQELGLTGTVSPASAAKVGDLTGAKVLVTGKVFKAGKETFAVAKIIGVETGRVFGETATIKDDVAASVGDLAKKIASTIHAKGETLVGKSMPREERIGKIVAANKREKPLAVSVVIPEQHFGARVVDPAAQTQLLSILQQAGFEIVDDKSEKPADVQISGEAFSAFGLRKGNLVACKSRVELKVQSRAGGKIIFTGAQTSAAIDIAEQTAAKTALENAAIDLAEKILPKLKQI